MSEPDQIVEADALRSFCVDLLTAVDVPSEQAATITDTLVEADLRGTASHGAHLLALYVSRLRAGSLAPETHVTTVRDDDSTVLLDAHLGFGQVAGTYAVDLAIERASAHGVAVVAVREITHLGALAYYTQRAANAGCIALLAQNGPAFVPPYGGLDGVFSTNPFSYAVPASDGPPIVFDIATTAVAGNKILLAKKRGDATIPPGWAADENGNPTTDTEAASLQHLSWFGGHKGYGIAFLVELLAGVLADSSYGRTENSASKVTGAERVAKGCTFVVVDVERFLPGGAFGERVDRLVADVQSVRPAPGYDRVLAPGQLEHETKLERLARGIPLSSGLLAELDGFATELGIAPLTRVAPDPSTT